MVEPDRERDLGSNRDQLIDVVHRTSHTRICERDAVGVPGDATHGHLDHDVLIEHRVFRQVVDDAKHPVDQDTRPFAMLDAQPPQVCQGIGRGLHPVHLPTEAELEVRQRAGDPEVLVVHAREVVVTTRVGADLDVVLGQHADVVVTCDGCVVHAHVADDVVPHARRDLRAERGVVVQLTLERQLDRLVHAQLEGRVGSGHRVERRPSDVHTLVHEPAVVDDVPREHRVGRKTEAVVTIGLDVEVEARRDDVHVTIQGRIARQVVEREGPRPHLDDVAGLGELDSVRGHPALDQSRAVLLGLVHVIVVVLHDDDHLLLRHVHVDRGVELHDGRLLIAGGDQEDDHEAQAQVDVAHWENLCTRIFLLARAGRM